MKLKILIILFLSILTVSIYAGDTIFARIDNKTWFESNNHAGTSIVFYETNGLIKAIRQNHGSGVPVVRSVIYDVEIRQETVFLFNGLNLKTSEKLEDLNYNFDNRSGLLLNKGKPLEIFHEVPWLFAWTDKRKNLMTQIDVKLLSEILIGKNEIYKDEDLIKTLKDN